MADRFDKFTERARRALSNAQEESQRFNHDYIGTEHLLLGLTREEEGLGAVVISDLGVRLSDVRLALESRIGRGEGTPGGKVGLTPQSKKVIELAVGEARRLHHSYIGTEHLLLGLLREGEGIAFDVLVSFGILLEKARAETVRVLSEGGPAGRRRSFAVPEAQAAILETMGAIDALGSSDLATDLSRSLLLPILGSIRTHLDYLTVGNVPVTYNLEIWRQIQTSLQLLDEAANAFERHGNGHAASLLTETAAKVRAAAG